MINMRILKNRYAISPVIATIIIVAVTIAVAIAVAFWMGGLTGVFTRFEKLEITSAYANITTTAGGTTTYYINLIVKNTGTTTATIDNIFINGRPFSTYKDVEVNGATTTPSLPIQQGQVQYVVVKLPGGSGSEFSSGMSVEVRIHTAAGQEYPRTVVLP
jgi:flagellin-like protein